MKKMLNFGCGPGIVADGWVNSDASPTLILQKLPLIGAPLTRNRVKFDSRVVYKNILNIGESEFNSYDYIFSSHVLEHLSLEDFRKTLFNCFKLLKSRGIFRLIMPDIKVLVENYMKNKDFDSIKLIESMGIGVKSKPKNFFDFLISYLGNSKHLWLWDYETTLKELDAVGFKKIRKYNYGEYDLYPEFSHVEKETRFLNSFAVECTK